MTIEEKHLIDRFHAGQFDGMVGNMFETTGGSLVWTEIKRAKSRAISKALVEDFSMDEKTSITRVYYISLLNFPQHQKSYRSFRNLVGLCKIKRPTSIVPNSNKNA